MLILLSSRRGGSVAAAPLAHGDSYTVNGSGFGAHADYNTGDYAWQGDQFLPFRWADFANGYSSTETKSAWLAHSRGFFPQTSHTFTANYQTAGLTLENGGPSQGGKYIKRVYTGVGIGSPRLCGFEAEFAGVADGLPLYTCFKFRITGSGQGGKWWRQYYTNNANFFCNTASNGTMSCETNSNTCEFYPGGNGVRYWDHSGNNGVYEDIGGFSEWRRLEIFQGEGEGNSRIYIDGQIIDGGSSSAADVTDYSARCTGYDPDYADFPHMIDEAGQSYEIADIFLDCTYSRIELRKSGVREIQIPTAWADGSITFRINQGEIASLSGAEIHLVTSYQTNNQIGTLP